MVEAWSIGFHALHILSCSLYSTTTIEAAILVPFLGEAQRMIKDILIGATQTPYFAYKRRVQLSADNLSCRLTLRQYYWRYVACTTSTIIPEFAHEVDSTDRKQK
jgi:hypothetical protein